MGEICPKSKSYPPLIKQKLISSPPHIMIILRLTPPLPPLKKSLLPSIPSNLVYLLDFFVQYKHHFKWLFKESFEESSESLDSELVSSSHELGDSSSSTVPLAVRVPREWVAWELRNSCLIELFFFEAQFNHTVFYLPYFKFVSLLKFQQLGFSFC